MNEVFFVKLLVSEEFEEGVSTRWGAVFVIIGRVGVLVKIGKLWQRDSCQDGMLEPADHPIRSSHMLRKPFCSNYHGNLLLPVQLAARLRLFAKFFWIQRTSCRANIFSYINFPRVRVLVLGQESTAPK